MTRARVIAAAAAGVLLVFGIVIVLAPAVLGPLRPLLERGIDAGASNGPVVLLAIGAVAAFGGILVARRHTPRAQATRLDIERLVEGVDSRTAGRAFDARLEDLRTADNASTRAELADSLREDLRTTAVTVLMHTEDWTAAETRAHLEEGTWAADPQAVAVFTGTPPPLSVRLREWLRAESATAQRLARAIEALDARLTGDATTAGRPPGAKTPAQEPASNDDRPRADRRGGTTRHQVTEESDGPIGGSTVERTARVPTDAATEPSRPVTAQAFGIAVGLLSVALGAVTGTTAPFLFGVLAVAYTGSRYLTDAPPPTVTVTRVLGTDEPVPGDLIEVQVRIENVGERPLADLRVIDGPPDALRVVDGSPAILTSLQPGGTDQFSYTVQAKRGTFTFAETRLIARSLSGVRERACTLTVPTRLSSTTLLQEFPLQEQTSQRIGTVKTDHGGSGVEFYATREYRKGDPLSRVDWNHLAKTGTLTTVQFREQRAPTVALLLDQREEARVAPRTAALDGVDLSVYAAEQAFLTLFDAGTEVGLVTYGEHLTAIEPGNDAAQRAQVQAELRAATDRYAAALGAATVDTASLEQRTAPTVDSLTDHVPRNAQVLLLSPATDDFVVETTERLRAFGHPVTLLSPAVAGAASLGARRERLHRTCRLRAVRETGTRVIEWQPTEPVQLAITRATEQFPNV